MPSFPWLVPIAGRLRSAHALIPPNWPQRAARLKGDEVPPADLPPQNHLSTVSTLKK
jgi:hypothetical protein